MQIGSKEVSITDSTEYSGRTLSSSSLHETEIEHRIARASAKFMSLKRELCSKHYPLRQRILLFESTVSPAVLYGSGTWTMSAGMEKGLLATQRRVLWWMVGVARQRHIELYIKDDSSKGSTRSSSQSDPSESE